MATKKPKLTKTRASYENTGNFQFDNSVVPQTYLVPTDRAVRIFCDGIFDLFHFGHCRLLKQAKNIFPSVYLIVGINSDADAVRYKGRPILSAEERYESIFHCKYADEIIRDSPWVIEEDFLERHEIDFVVHDGASYASGDVEDIYSVPKRLGKFIPSMRTNAISTTDLITRVLRDKKTNYYRQLRKGVSRTELEITFIKEQWILLSFQGARAYAANSFRKFLSIFKEGFSQLLKYPTHRSDCN